MLRWMIPGAAFVATLALVTFGQVTKVRSHCQVPCGIYDDPARVRMMRATIDHDLVIRCPTFAGTNKVGQIRAEPEVHVTCGDVDPDHAGSYFQIEGRAEISVAENDRLAAWNDRLAKWFTGPGDSNYAVVKITPYRITALPIGGGPPAEIWEHSS